MKLLLTTLALIAVSLVRAQPGPNLAFDVTSVKQRPMFDGVIRRPHFNSGAISCSDPNFDCGISGTRFSDSPASLLDLIMDAYRVRAIAIVGLPGWGDSGYDLYDVTARIPANVPPTLDNARRMLQTLLADRFKLRIHQETRVLPVYELMIAKKPRLFKSSTPCGVHSEGSSPDNVVPVPMRWEQIPARLSGRSDRPVIDKTGFDAESRYCLPGRDSDPTILLMRTLSLPSSLVPQGEVAGVVNSLEDTLGLKLVPRKEPMEILVIDHVERPSPN